MGLELLPELACVLAATDRIAGGLAAADTYRRRASSRC
jgi:hypothetical protein